MTSSGNTPRKGTPPATEDTTGLTILAEVASQQAHLPPSVPSATPAATGLASPLGGATIEQLNFNSSDMYSLTDPKTGQRMKCVLVNDNDKRLTTESMEQFDYKVLLDDKGRTVKHSEEAIENLIDGLRRKQAYRGRGYAGEIVELSAEEAREKAEKKAKEEQEERKRAGKEAKEAKETKEKTEREEGEKKKKMKKEAQMEEARKRKEAKKGAAARRRNFQPEIKVDYDLD